MVCVLGCRFVLFVCVWFTGVGQIFLFVVYVCGFNFSLPECVCLWCVLCLDYLTCVYSLCMFMCRCVGVCICACVLVFVFYLHTCVLCVREFSIYCVIYSFVCVVSF